MSIKGKFKITKKVFQNNDFFIWGASPITPYSQELKLNKYFCITLKGLLGFLTEGKEYELEVEEIATDNYGTSYNVVACNIDCKKLENLTREESIEIMEEITTPSQARNCIDAYENFIHLAVSKGKEAFDLSKIHNVGEYRLNAYIRDLTTKYKYLGIMNKFKNWRVDVEDCKKLLDKYENEHNIKKAFQENPYVVNITDLGRNFEYADKMIIEKREDLKQSEQRCSYLILSVLERNELDGDTYLDANDLYNYIIEEYPIARDLERFIVPCVTESKLFYYDDNTKRIAISATYNGECMIRDLVNNKISNPHKLDIDWTKYTNVDGFELTEEQGLLLKNFCEYDITCLIGKAGSGKTSSTKALVKLMEDNDITYTLLTPTGASALRVTEQTNRQASTIHRKCLRDGQINSDVIVIDEFGMVGLDVFVMLLNCVTNEECKFVLSGDPYQIPSIQKGCLFSDIINSNKVPMAELTRVFRYDTNGGAFVGENIRQGKKFLDDDKVRKEGNIYKVLNDYKFIQTDDIFDNVISEYTKLRKKYKENEIIILSPFNKGDCGTYKLNEAIELEYNPPKPNENTLEYKRDGVNIVFRVGSRVVNTKNDYKAIPLESFMQIENSYGELTEEDVPLTQLFNGQIGTVRQVEDKYLVCQFEEELIVFSKTKIQNLLLARAISTHRSQGGEWKAVINVISSQHTRLLSKQLLYVSNTRMKEYHCDIGDRDTLESSLLVDVVASRNTWLEDLLNEKE